MHDALRLPELEDSPQVHFLVETCLTRHMTQSETVRALQAAGVTPSFTEIGASAAPLSHELASLSSYQVFQSRIDLSTLIRRLVGRRRRGLTDTRLALAQCGRSWWSRIPSSSRTTSLSWCVCRSLALFLVTLSRRHCADGGHLERSG